MISALPELPWLPLHRFECSWGTQPALLLLAPLRLGAYAPCRTADADAMDAHRQLLLEIAAARVLRMTLPGDVLMDPAVQPGHTGWFQ